MGMISTFLERQKMTLGDFGLNVSLLIAGFAGGVVHAAVARRGDPGAQVASVIAGTLAANYLTPIAANILHISGTGLDNGGGGLAFIIGVSAMTIVQLIPYIVRSRMDRIALKEIEKREEEEELLR
jgi:hypothetical protein